MLVIIAIIVAVIAIAGAAYAMSDKGKAAEARYCTKHVITHGIGPDKLAWVHGVHRTPGNQCDGPEHRRSPNWW